MPALFSRAVLTDLQERVRTATGPDRELDARIWAEFDGRDVRQDHLSHWNRSGLLAKSRRPPHDECVLGLFHGKLFMGVGQKPPTPQYTTSIDAAVALVEEVLPDANCHGYERSPTEVLAHISRNNVASGHWFYEAEHPTSAPLAILDAMLSAVLSREE